MNHCDIWSLLIANDAFNKNSSLNINRIDNHLKNNITYNPHQNTPAQVQQLIANTESLKSQLHIKNMPLFNFKSDLTNILQQTIHLSSDNYNQLDMFSDTGGFYDLLALENMFYEYIDLLRDYYFNLFCSKIHNYDYDNDLDNGYSSKMQMKDDHMLFCEETKAIMTNEFYAALKASRPQLRECESWNTEVGSGEIKMLFQSVC